MHSYAVINSTLLDETTTSYDIALHTLKRKKSSSSNTERRQLLGESITICIVQASAYICKQLVECIIQFCLILRRLSAQYVVLVLREAGFAS